MLRGHRKEWSIFTAESASEALQIVHSDHIDVIVSDVHMPGVDGFELLRRLQEDKRTRNIPVIILTGSGESAHKKHALDLGATDLLSKPVEYGNLIARIINSLRIKSYQDEIITQNITLEDKVKARTAELEFLHYDLIWRLAKVGEMRDEDTGNHVIRVARYSQLIAQKIGLSEKESNLIYLTSPLHDLGKVGIPDKILLKTGPLDPDEWSIMRNHSNIGAEILLDQPRGLERVAGPSPTTIGSFDLNDEIRIMAATIAQTHHEKWDGTGYPGSLVGAEIPLVGRIVAIADVYDALRTERPYKAAFDKEKAWGIIAEGAGSHFDPDLFFRVRNYKHLFEEIHDQYKD